jgi:H+/gluconate symporter-like permease
MESTLIIVSIIAGIVGTITGVLGLAFTMISNKRHAQEKAEEQERHAQEMEMQKQELARNNRLMFLADRIFDLYIPKEFKLPFYKEYISMKGNGTAVRFWQLEAEMEKKMQQPA